MERTFRSVWWPLRVWAARGPTHSRAECNTRDKGDSVDRCCSLRKVFAVFVGKAEGNLSLKPRYIMVDVTRPEPAATAAAAERKINFGSTKKDREI